jgi:hypothetical protein
MNRGPLDPVLQYVRRLVTPPAEREASDQQLLERFVTGHDQSAFSALVERHGAMVLGVCRRLLENDQDRGRLSGHVPGSASQSRFHP